MSPPLEPRAVAAAPAPAPWRAWLAGFAAFLAVNAGLLAWARAAPRALELEVLAALLLYTSLACTFLPLPTAWIVLWAGRELGPAPVAVVATLGTCIANLHDWHIVRGLCGVGHVRRARETRLYARAVAWFRRAPFLALSMASFLPLPIDAVRLLAASEAYPRWRYVLATFAGRLPRYGALAFLGHELRLSNRAIAAVLIAVVAIGAAKGLLGLRERARAEEDAP
jgi:membrane protein YqaA with SNARE-associated domain